jgi:nucleotide-binding universal stress UspA family protein
MQLPKLIVAPVDFSEHSHEAVQVAAEYASRLDAEVLLVHAVPAIPKLTSPAEFFHEAEYEDELRKDAERQLRALAQGLADKGVRARTEIGIANDVGMEILRIAEHSHADLIVLATHGMTGWHKLAFGSVAEKVLKLATCPVLVLPAIPEPKHEATSTASPSVAARYSA